MEIINKPMKAIAAYRLLRRILIYHKIAKPAIPESIALNQRRRNRDIIKIKGN
jgi:hypothetical protein